MIKEKYRYVLYGVYKILFWRFLGKNARRKKGTGYSKYKEAIDKIEGYFNSIELPDDEEKLEVVSHIRKKGLETVFPYDFIHNYFLQAALSIFYDKDKQMYYAKRKGKRLYLKQDTYAKSLNYYWNLIYEQDRKSPHLYSEKKVDGDILLDIGGAEGFFALDHANDFSKIYIFEGDKTWLPALNETFKQFKEKVFIIDRFVGDSTNEDYVSLDDFVKQYDIDCSKSIFIKMDVEGAEMNVLKGAAKLLKDAQRIHLSVCTYHKQNDEKEIKEELESYNRFSITYSKGYMILFYMDDVKEPYLRRGVLRAEAGF